MRLHRTIITACFALALAACGSQPFDGNSVEAASFLERSVSQQQGPITVTTAVPTAAETEALTGLNLYEQGIQPVWLEVTNNSDRFARVVPWSIDPEYFSPIEVAYMNRKPYSKEGYAAMERWFKDNAMERYLPAGETRRGLVFTHYVPGTKGFNLDVITAGEFHTFTFLVPMPGFVPDYVLVDFDSLYPPGERKDLTLEQLQSVLENDVECCARRAADGKFGAPINVALVGTPLAVRRALLRGQWLETSAGGEDQRDLVIKARKQRVFDRPPDATFAKLRGDGNETVNLNLWMSPWSIDGETVWIGQTLFWGDADSFISQFAQTQAALEIDLIRFVSQESTIADLDSARTFLWQNFWYSGSLKALGHVTGVGESTIDDPHVTDAGIAYFTDGYRVVAFLSEDPLAFNETDLILRTVTMLRGEE